MLLTATDAKTVEKKLERATVLNTVLLAALGRIITEYQRTGEPRLALRRTLLLYGDLFDTIDAVSAMLADQNPEPHLLQAARRLNMWDELVAMLSHLSEYLETELRLCAATLDGLDCSAPKRHGLKLKYDQLMVMCRGLGRMIDQAGAAAAPTLARG